MDTSILLTGATGNIGQVVAAELARRGVPFVAMARSGSRRAALTARGITAIHGDFDDPASLAPALRGVRTAYLVCTPDEHLVRRETAFIRAARAAGVRRIVKCSAYMAGDDAPTQNLRSHGAIERVLLASGMEGTIVRPHGFMQTFTLFSWDLIQRAGVLSNPTGDGGMPLVDVRDVAQVVVRAIVDDGHVGRAYDLTGPESLDGHRMAEILESVLGRPIDFIPAAPAPFALMMRLLGVPPVPTEHVVTIMRLTREHRLERVEPTLTSLGIRPTTYEEFVRDLVAGRTGGGNSFKPPEGALARLLAAAMPAATRLRIRALGRSRRPARAS